MSTAAAAERLFEGFLAPLVLGGSLRPGDPLGPEKTREVAANHPTTDVDLRGRFDLARVRSARRLAPLDRLEEAQDGPVWALAACLHDLVVTAHPDLPRPFQGENPARLLALVGESMAAISGPENALEALQRHTAFARIFEIARVDREVTWWTGKANFLGEPVPKRLLAWPEMRNVRVKEQRRSLRDLPNCGGHVNEAAYGEALAGWLARTPLTDLATLGHEGRNGIPFAFQQSHVRLLRTQAGRTLTLRAESTYSFAHLSPEPNSGPAISPEKADKAWGTAALQLASAKRWGDLSVVVAHLGERLLARLIRAQEIGKPMMLAPESEEMALLATTWGAVWAAEELARRGNAFPNAVRLALVQQITPLSTHRTAGPLRAVWRSAP